MNPRLVLVLLAAPALLVVGALFGPLRVRPAAGDHLHAAHSAMGDAAMRCLTEAYWATHPRVGSPASDGSPTTPGRSQGIDATFTVSGTIFNADGNGATKIDTVHISAGQSVLWQWISGFHTITSGTGTLDPNAGLVFDQPSDTNNRQFLFTFATPETVPFFCSPHEGSGMKGVVIVTAPVGVPPQGGGKAIGFASGPWPNPSARGVHFRFASGEAGRVRADVVDARGRLVATIVDREFTAGTHEAAWDGRGPGGRAPAGAYWLRLRVPGFSGGRNFVLTR